MKIVTLKHKKLNEEITYWNVKDVKFYDDEMILTFEKPSMAVAKKFKYYDITIANINIEEI